MNEPIISIIVPVYKVEKYLDRCLFSIINQTVKDIEVILVDDGSPDKCSKICDEYAKKDSRIKVIHKENGGLGFARNTGLDIARGKYIGFVDSDDSIKLNMFEVLLEHAIKDQCDIVIGGYTRVKNNGEEINYNGEGIEKIYKNEEIHDLLIDMIGTKPNDYKDMRCNMAVWKCLYSRELIEKNKIRFHSEREFISEDLIFHIDLLGNSQKVKIIPDCLYYYYDNYNSLTTIYNPQRLEKNILLCKEVKRKLDFLYGMDDDIFIDRLLLSRIKTVIIQIIESKQVIKNGWKQELRNVRNNLEVKNLFNRYPFRKMVLKQRIFYLFFKHRFFNLVKLLVYLNRRG